MNFLRRFKPVKPFAIFSLLFLILGAVPTNSFITDPAPLPSLLTPKGMTSIVSLVDFRGEEVKGAGFVLPKQSTIHISALGGGDRIFWRDMFNDNDDSRMYAGGWIIDAETREPVWIMSMDNTSGPSEHRTFEGTVKLEKGAYEIYFSAHGYYHSSAFSSSSVNIDRRPEARRGRRSLRNLFGIFDRDSEGVEDDFLDAAREYGISVSIDDADASGVTMFDAPRGAKFTIFSATRIKDGEAVKQGLKVTKAVTLQVYALGEGQARDEIYDHGWIINSETRERVWAMNDRSVRYAGGAGKNIMWKGDLQLDRGEYELYYVTDDSHSSDDWNAKPPYDPFNYGITLSAANESDKSAVVLTDIPELEKNVIVNLVRVRDDEFVSAGFTLKNDTRVRVYCLGERDNDDEMADYGWIVNAKTRERVWSMDGRDTYHAGGAAKNRMLDEVISLPKGDYIAYYQTDGSHSYNDWNSDPPYDENHYGMLVMGQGERFDAGSVTPFSEEDEENVIAQLIRVRDDRHVSKSFSLDKPTRVRIYAIGEGTGSDLADYGWIEDAKTGRTVWEMTYRMTSRAGGARKNRLVSTTITLEKGEYELHYRTDDSHAYHDWNADPPEDRSHWGITIYREQ